MSTIILENVPDGASLTPLHKVIADWATESGSRVGGEVDDRATTYRFTPVFVPLHVNKPGRAPGEGIQRS